MNRRQLCSLPDCYGRVGGRMRDAFTETELAAVVVVIGVLVAAGWMMRSRLRGCHESSQRVVCGANLRAIGNAMKIYAASNADEWPVPAFDESAAGHIRYTVPIGGGDGTRRSPSRDQPSESGSGGARELSTSRVFWMLIRSGETVPKTYICPRSGKRPNPSRDIGKHYDFASDANLSYGLHVPFGPRMSRIGEWSDPRMPVAADRGPFVNASVPPPPVSLNSDSPPSRWTAYNSPNTHRCSTRAGQNVYFMDGHVDFENTPLDGIDHDNMYTAVGSGSAPGARMRGESPWVRNVVPAVAETPDGKPLATTDSLIFP